VGSNSGTTKNITSITTSEIITQDNDRSDDSDNNAKNNATILRGRITQQHFRTFETTIRPTYSDLRDEIQAIVENQTWIFRTSYEQSTAVEANNGIDAKKGQSASISSFTSKNTKLVCREKCCVETVLISLDQDDRKLLNWRNDVQDLADVMIQNFDNKDASIHATNLYSEDLIPCFVPNTIISVDNFDKSIQYFWQQVRPKIHVPFLLLTGGSDFDSPFYNKKWHPTMPDYIADPLLLKWHGTNPRTKFLLQDDDDHYHRHKRFREHGNSKFRSMLSGLSYLHPQERYLSTYLELTNYTNPFSNFVKQKGWSSLLSSLAERNIDSDIDIEIDFDFDRDVFVHFGQKRNPLRQHLWNILCPNTTTETTSCNRETNHIPLHEMYTDMTRNNGRQSYKFGISPPGMGYDCYRHYEMWYLGIIPVIWERDTESHHLYKDLPVVQLNADQQQQHQQMNTRQDFANAIQDYLQSTEFRDAVSNGIFEKGWDRLFFRNKRRSVLKDSNRDRDIVVDDKTGIEYYQAYRYYLKESGSNSTTTAAKTTHDSIYCHYANENCAIRDNDGAVRSVDWVDDLDHKHNIVDQDWIDKWSNAK